MPKFFLRILLALVAAPHLLHSQSGALPPDHTIRLTPSHPSSQRLAAIVAPGSGLHRYNIFYIDTLAFPAGGVLDIDIQVSPNSATDASFDLFPGNVPVPPYDSIRGTLAGRYNIRRGSSTRLEYRLATGQILAFGAEGNWGGSRGALGSVQFRATMQGNAAALPDAGPLPPRTQAPGCPDLAGHWVSHGGLALDMRQSGCTIASDNADAPGFHHTVRGRWDPSQYSFTWVMARIDSQHCETHLFGQATVTGPSTLSLAIAGTEGRCGLSRGYTEQRNFTRQ